ncbi:MAG: extensin family protein [Hyphomicrobiaceae bacterium]|nr:extensin family protein [Hyphomicrobiaceae bacterium]
MAGAFLVLLCMQPGRAEPSTIVPPPVARPDVAPRAPEGTPARPQADLSTCGVASPVEVDAIGPLSLQPVFTFDERLVETVENFIPTLQALSEAHLGARVAGLRVAAGYVCRTRNRRPGARISRHAFGWAIDIRAFRLDDGREVSIETGWNGAAEEQAFLRAVHDAACGPFNTVLGPQSDSYHRDHFHFDIDPQRRRGPYCR